MENQFVSYHEMVEWEKRIAKEKDFFKNLFSQHYKRPLTILDVGCGLGYHLFTFVQWGHNGVGIDIDGEIIEKAKKNAHSQKLSSVQFLQGDMTKINSLFPKRKFDIIINLGNSLSLFDEEIRIDIISQLKDLLVPDGLVLFQVVNYLRHENETEWMYKPTLRRGEDGFLNFYVRTMEWYDKNRIHMYVHKIKQENQKTNFRYNTKIAEFNVIRKEDFKKFESSFNFQFYGSFEKEKFKEEQSNDLIILLKKKKERASQK